MSYENQMSPWLNDVMTKGEEHEYFNSTLDLIIENPRYYLDNLNTLFVFRVSWSSGIKTKPTAL